MFNNLKDIQFNNESYTECIKEFLYIYNQINNNNSNYFLCKLYRLFSEKRNLGWHFTLPIRLYKILSWHGNVTPPPDLASNNYENIIKAYNSGKDKAVEELLNSLNINNKIRANAYTCLARYLVSIDKNITYEYARSAFIADPVIYRLKWLAFKAIDAKKYIIAKIIIGILPSNTQYSASEKRRLEYLDSQLYAAMPERKTAPALPLDMSSFSDRNLINSLQARYNALLESFKLVVKSNNQNRLLNSKTLNNPQ